MTGPRSGGLKFTPVAPATPTASGTLYIDAIADEVCVLTNAEVKAICCAYLRELRGVSNAETVTSAVFSEDGSLAVRFIDLLDADPYR